MTPAISSTLTWNVSAGGGAALQSSPALIEMERITASVAEARDLSSKSSISRSCCSSDSGEQPTSRCDVATDVDMVYYRCTLLLLLPHHGVHPRLSRFNAAESNVRAYEFTDVIKAHAGRFNTRESLITDILQNIKFSHELKLKK